MRARRLIGFLLLLALLQEPAAAVAQEAPLQGIDDYINKALKDWEVPGLAIAVVKNDKVLFARGYGVKKAGDPAPVSEKTLFAIGSSSKAFTAAALGMLVDESKVKWDEPATRYLPGLQLFDPYATRELSVRDLLSHRSGLERGDLMWYGSDYNRDEILRRIRYLKPSWSFRSRFGYQNIMYLAAGEAVAKVAGRSWDDFVKERIFKPLGMTASSTSIRDLPAGGDVATPHTRIDNQVQTIPWRNIDNIAPAGSINSNVLDMAQWVRLHLGEGKFNGQTILTSGTIKEMHTPQTVIRLEGVQEKLNPDTRFMTYGLGWFLQDYKGRKVVHHGGNIDGMSALVTMIPEEELGLVILTNMNGTPLPTALMYKVFDSFIQWPGTPRDWSAELLKVYKANMAIAAGAEKKKEAERVKGTSPSLELKKYAATYNSEMYGDVKVAEENGKLTARYGPAFAGDLEHWHYDTFRITWRDRTLGRSLITFTLDAAGKTDEIKVETLGNFKRAAEKAEEVAGLKLGEEELKKYLGAYEMKTPPLEISIEMIGGKLKGVIPGQPVATLVPVAANRFKVVVEGAAAEIFLQFDMDGNRPKSMTLEQGGARFTLTPK